MENVKKDADTENFYFTHVTTRHIVEYIDSNFSDFWTIDLPNLTSNMTLAKHFIIWHVTHRSNFDSKRKKEECKSIETFEPTMVK